MPDIFDQVAATSKGDIFDQIAPGQTPEQAAALRLTRGLISDRGLRPGPPQLEMKGSVAPKLVRGFNEIALPAVGGVIGGLSAAPTVVGTGLGVGGGTALGISAGQSLDRTLFGTDTPRNASLPQRLGSALVGGSKTTEPAPFSPRGMLQAGEGGLESGLTSGLTAKLMGVPLRMPRPAAAPTEAELRAANAALGVHPDEIRMSAGTGDSADIASNPAKSVMEKTGLSPKQLAKMTPFEKAEAIEPHYQRAGAELSRVVDDATSAGKTIDVRSDLLKAAKRFADPQDETKFIRMVNNVASDLGITQQPTLLGAKPQDLTPRQSFDLREALQERIPNSYAEYRAGMYRAITDKLSKEVPEFGPANQTRSELSSGRWANLEAAQKFMKTAPPPSTAMRALKVGARIAAGAGGLGGAYALGRGAFRELVP